MENRSFFAIIPDSLHDEFIAEVEKLEQKHEIIQQYVLKVKGNNFGMTGNTYCFNYSKGGKYKAFTKELKFLWENFNQKHPKTKWRGK